LENYAIQLDGRRLLRYGTVRKNVSEQLGHDDGRDGGCAAVGAEAMRALSGGTVRLPMRGLGWLLV